MCLVHIDGHWSVRCYVAVGSLCLSILYLGVTVIIVDICEVRV